MKLVWSRYALEDRRSIFDYLESRDPAAAADMDEMIETSVLNLRSYPKMGRPGRVDTTRELVIVGTPFIVAYVVMPDRVKLLRVLHGAQEWPKWMPEI
jgi:addiction module RelE/StbE family toxin